MFQTIKSTANRNWLYDHQEILSALNSGQLDKAVRLSERASVTYPLVYEIRELHGVALSKAGELDRAIPVFEQAIVLNPNSNAYRNLARALFDSGLYEAAIERLKESKDRGHSDGETENLHGVALIKLGRVEEARTLLEGVKEEHAQTLSIFTNLAELYLKSDSAGEAVSLFEGLVKGQPRNARLLCEFGKVLVGADLRERARGQFLAAIELEPADVDSYKGLGQVFCDEKNYMGALECFNVGMRLAPGDCDLLTRIGFALEKMGNEHKALEFIKRTVELEPNVADYFVNLAHIYSRNQQPEVAEKQCREALRLDPNSAGAYSNLGVALRDQGKFDDAIEAFSMSLANNSLFTYALYGIATTRLPLSEEIFAFAQVQRRDEQKLSRHERAVLNFTLYRVYSDLGDSDRAFSHLTKANCLEKSIRGYSADKDKEKFKRLRSLSSEWVDLQATPESDSQIRPIFVFGMPRSGTTLVEQIITSHDEVHGLGEAPYVGRHIINALSSDQPLSDRCSEFRRKYLAAVASSSSGFQYVTDKSPHNFLYTLMLAQCFPEAKFVHVFREPSATCWSNFETYFPSPALSYSFDLCDVAEYYNLYVDLMSHYSDLLGDRIFHLNYDHLTVSQKRVTGDLMDYLELPLSDAVFHPENNDRSILTASATQVRQPVFQGSSKKWMRYAGFIGGAFDNLKAFCPPKTS
jgi:tetratricopeptide (TPR) repeat protein